MRVFLYEFITGGGLLGSLAGALGSSLLSEGSAMIGALAADFADLPGIQVELMRDHRLSTLGFPSCHVHDVTTPADEPEVFLQLASAADWTVVIAPETEGALLARCEQVLAAGGRLLGPALELVRLAGDKHACAAHLRAHGIPVPESRLLEPGERLPWDWPYPAVLKPVDGAGSQGLRLVLEPPTQSTEPVGSRSVLERLIHGWPASVSLLCGPAGNVSLTPCRQHLSEDGRFAYLGGSLPLSDNLAERARRLAERAVATLPLPLGYVGVDLILGPSDLGDGDYVIEINPRLTTSYVGLRAAAKVNLADAMLRIAAGQRVDVSFEDTPVSFTSTGNVFPRL